MAPENKNTTGIIRTRIKMASGLAFHLPLPLSMPHVGQSILSGQSISLTPLPQAATTTTCSANDDAVISKPKHPVSSMQTGSVQPIRALPSPPQRFYDFSNKIVQAVRATHCRVDTAEMAAHVFEQVRTRQSVLSDLATMLSTCEETKQNSGDTGWLKIVQHSESAPGNRRTSSWNDDTNSAIPEEFQNELVQSRPGALQCVELSYGWEVFTTTDVRHAITPTALGALRKPGFPITGNMRRNSHRKPDIIPNSYFIETFGCQMNGSDSERMAACLEEDGYIRTPHAHKSALYIVNTCALREHAQSKVYSHLGPHAQRKWDAPTSVTLIVAGCVAQQEGTALLSQVPEVDIVMGPQYANRITEVLKIFHERSAQVVAVDPVHIHEDISVAKRGSKVTAWVNVIYGCLEKCTYCVVPNTRGLEQSRGMNAIRDEVAMLVGKGYKEVVLLGQNVDAYGRDLSPKRTLADLFRHIHDIEGLRRIRFTTGHPRYISDNLIQTVADLPKVMEHFHIPPQSGDDGVLKDMRRGYTAKRYAEIAQRIRKSLPDASICADMIVGFPGESDEAFENSVRLAEEVVFDANMVRAYSARPNTDAALRKDQVDEEIKKQRLGVMNRLMRDQALHRSRRYLGRIVEVLVEGENEKVAGEVSGRERTNRVVFFSGGCELVGCVVRVYIEEAFAFSLRGTLVDVVE